LPDSSAAARLDSKKTLKQSLRGIISLPIVMAFIYFTLLAMALSGTQSFMPTMLPKVQNVSVLDAGHALTLYLVFNASGSFIGGYLADLTKHHERIVGAGLALAALLMLVLAFIPLFSLLPIILVSILMGFLIGLTIPSRDMLVRSATPPGSTGKVFGFVYSGLDLGSLIAPAVIGALLDKGLFHMPFVFISTALFMTIILAFGVKSSDAGSEPGFAPGQDHRLPTVPEPALQRDQAAAQANRDNVGAAARP
jgi:MFS family permease